jgi:hypothetical protein
LEDPIAATAPRTATAADGVLAGVKDDQNPDAIA